MPKITKKQKRLEKLAMIVHEAELTDLTPKQIEDLQEHLAAKDRIDNMKREDKFNLLVEGVRRLKAQEDCEEL